MTFRPPLITRQEPVKRAPEFQQSNLLETTLRSKDALPFRQRDWPNPRGPEFPVSLRTWTDSYKLQLIGKDRLPTRQSDWPNPRGPEFAIDLRTWTNSYKLGLIGKDALPTRQRDWPNPKLPGIDTRADQQSRNLALTQVVVQAPFSVREWPNPLPTQVPVIPQQDVNLALNQVVVVQPPFSLADWPNPSNPVGWVQWDVQNILPLTEVTPTPTPTPSPDVGGARGRRYPIGNLDLETWRKKHKRLEARVEQVQKQIQKKRDQIDVASYGRVRELKLQIVDLNKKLLGLLELLDEMRKAYTELLAEEEEVMAIYTIFRNLH